ncbi:MAG: hypothetical protein ABWZ25_12200 [Chitinophagaceae bacterium]
MQPLTTKEIMPLNSNDRTPLVLIKNLLEQLHNACISYCHWKSNEHLDASVTGDTDLDILFNIEQKKELLTLFAELGFVKFEAVKYKRYQDIEDYLGIDLQTGKLIHVHAHFRLTMGEPYLKGYQLNIEEQLLSTKVFDPGFGIYRTDPAHELVLLFCRQALKLRNRDKLKILLKKGGPVAPNFIKEFIWIKGQCTGEQVINAADSIFPGNKAIAEICVGELNKKQLAKLSTLLQKELKHARLYTPLVATLIRWQREALIKLTRRKASNSITPVVHKRVHTPGVAIAVVGADGSGKSTVITQLKKIFEKKLDVYPIYFGNGGYVSWSSKILRMAGKKRKPDSKTKTQKKETAVIRPIRSGAMKTFFLCLDALEIAGVKNRNLSRLRQARKKGMIVICDRYPQTQVFGYNDGPHLNHLTNSRNWLFRSMALREKAIFSKFNFTFPDVVFKLIADARLIESRKPGQTPLETLERKIKAIKELKFPPGCSVVTVDASHPPEKVLRTINKKIWEQYL